MRFRVLQNLGKTIQAYNMIIKQLTDSAAGTGLEQKLNSYVHEIWGNIQVLRENFASKML